jgi:hypothetical protein
MSSTPCAAVVANEIWGRLERTSKALVPERSKPRNTALSNGVRLGRHEVMDCALDLVFGKAAYSSRYLHLDFENRYILAQRNAHTIR